MIVGARAAGAATALLLARAGLRVLVIDRGAYGTDTLSTHALMRGGVVQLHKWGLLLGARRYAGHPLDELLLSRRHPSHSDQAVDASAVALRAAAIPAGSDPCRRGRLPPVRSCASASRSSTSRVTTDGSRACGLRGSEGPAVDCRANIVVGADGRHSAVARAAGAATLREGPHKSGVIFGYWPAAPGQRRIVLVWGPGAGAGAIPTNKGEWCVFASIAHDRFGDVFGHDRRAGYHRILSECAAPLFETLLQTGATPPLQGFAGLPGVIRESTGPGWALVGDAGYFKDPITAHGITDALRDAELLASAIIAGGDGALTAYQEARDDLSMPLFDITDAVASYAWTLDELKELHHKLSDEMKREVAAMSARESNRVTA